MKKQKIELRTLTIKKSKIAQLNANKALGGTDPSAFDLCYLSGPGNVIVCPITATCNTGGDHCVYTNNGCATVGICGTGNCNTLQDTTCIELCN